MRIIDMSANFPTPPQWNRMQPGEFLNQGSWSHDGLRVDPDKLRARLTGIDPATVIMLNVEVVENLPDTKYLDSSRYPSASASYRADLSYEMDLLHYPYHFYQTLRTVVRAYNKIDRADRDMEASNATLEGLAVQNWIGNGDPCVSAYWHGEPETYIKPEWDRWVRVTGKEIADCRYYAKRDPYVAFSHRVGGDIHKPLLSETLMDRQLAWLTKQDVPCVFWTWSTETEYQDWLPGKLWWYGYTE